jgi:L-2,4-diaminobutyric acid acetyltransferase
MLIRTSTEEDGAALWDLVKATGKLELNTSYCYLLMSKLFSQTTLVAEIDGQLAGFVMAFQPPEQEDTLFVWQVGVHPAYQGRRLATRLLKALFEENPEHTYLEASVTPSNAASLGLFRGFAKRNETKCEEGTFLPAHCFPKQHEEELLLRVGPLQPQTALIGG